MNEIQSSVLKIAKEFKRVCEKYNLRYYATCGTALGAVRHGGFIPWDFDMDFYMPRSDYNKLIELDKNDELQGTNDVFNKRFIFKHWDKTPNYIWSFGKLEDTTTTAVHHYEAENGIASVGGLWIDIFVLDGGGGGII